MEFPIALDLPDDENLAIAFRTGRFLALGHDRSVRASADEPKIVAHLHLQQLELNVEVQLRKKVCVECDNFLEACRRGERLADYDGIARVDAPDEIEISFVQTSLIGL